MDGYSNTRVGMGAKGFAGCMVLRNDEMQAIKKRLFIMAPFGSTYRMSKQRLFNASPFGLSARDCERVYHNVGAEGETRTLTRGYLGGF